MVPERIPRAALGLSGPPSPRSRLRIISVAAENWNVNCGLAASAVAVALVLATVLVPLPGVTGPVVAIVRGLPEGLGLFATKLTLGFAAIGRVVRKVDEGEEVAGCDIALSHSRACCIGM